MRRPLIVILLVGLLALAFFASVPWLLDWLMPELRDADATVCFGVVCWHLP